MKTYKFKYDYDLIDDYVFPENVDEWLECPECEAKPKVWVFDNGRHASCKCHNSKYDHRTISAEPIGESVRRNNGSLAFYDADLLRRVWNDYCKKQLEQEQMEEQDND